MLALAHHFDEPVSAGAVTYLARVYAGAIESGRWGGWIVFFPIGAGRVIATDRETTGASLPDISYWASGLTHTYLEGALERAVALQPEEQIARELERLERLELSETSATLRAESLEAAASAARAEARVMEAERERAEEDVLATVAKTAGTKARAHEAAAGVSRTTAKAATQALRARKGEPRSRKKK